MVDGELGLSGKEHLNKAIKNEDEALKVPAEAEKSQILAYLGKN